MLPNLIMDALNIIDFNLFMFSTEFRISIRINLCIFFTQKFYTSLTRISSRIRFSSSSLCLWNFLYKSSSSFLCLISSLLCSSLSWNDIIIIILPSKENTKELFIFLSRIPYLIADPSSTKKCVIEMHWQEKRITQF